MHRIAIITLGALGAFSCFTTAAEAQDPVLRVVDSVGVVGDPVPVPFELDHLGDETAGLSFGVCHDGLELVLDTADLGAALASVDGGAGPEFSEFGFFADGFTLGVVVDFQGVITLPAALGLEVAVGDYVPLAEASSVVSFCETLGSPPVELVVTPIGGSVSLFPTAVPGTVTGTAAAGTFRRGDLDGNGIQDQSDYDQLQELLYGTSSPFVGAPAPVGCDLQPNQSGDINDNEVETIADLLMFREWLDCGVITLPSPSDACGPDTDDDTGGFETPDPDYLISAFTISITGDVDQVRDVDILLQILSPTSVKAVSLGLELGSQLSPAPVPFTVAAGVTADFFDSAFDGTGLVVGAGSTGCGVPMMAGSASFQQLGTLHLELAPFAIFPPAQWKSVVTIDGRDRLTTIVDEAFQDHNPFLVSGSFEFARGNANNFDAFVDVADSVYTLGYLFQGLSLDCQDAADANNDGKIDIADPIFALAFLFTGGAPIPSPYPQCGYDIDIDTLDCESAVCP